MRALITNRMANSNHELVIHLIGTSSKTRQGGTTKRANLLRNKEGKIKDKTSADWPSSQRGERVDGRRDQRNEGIAGAMKMEMK